MIVFFFSSRRRHTRCGRDWSSDVCSSDLIEVGADLVLADLDEPEAQRLPARRGQAVLRADAEREAGRKPVARERADELRPPWPVGVVGRDADLARLAGAHAVEPLLERGEELPGAAHDRDGPAALRRVD